MNSITAKDFGGSVRDGRSCELLGAMLRLIFALAALLVVVSAQAAVTVTAATGGTAIPYTSTNTWVTLTGPSIAETGSISAGTSADEIQVGTYTLTAPAGFSFNTSSPVTVAVTGNRQGTDVTLASSTATVTSSTITVTVTALSTSNRRSVLTWSGIQVRPTACSPLSSGSITMTTSPAGTIFSGPNFGTLTQSSSLAFVQQPSMAQVGAAISPAVTVQPCGTTRPTVNVALTTAGGATLSGTTSASSASGLATFSNLSVNLGGTYTLTATASGFASVISSSFTINNLTPTTTSISPSSKNLGDNAFTMTVSGTNFNSSSRVYVDGSARTTTYVSPTQLTAAIPSSDMASAASRSVTVVNPAPVVGTGTSNAQTFNVNNPVPTLTSLSSTSKAVGSATFTMSLTGTNFNTSTVAYLDGVAKTTTYSRSTQVTFNISAADMASAGVHYITVVNPGPGGGTTAALPFVVTSTCTSRQTGNWSNATTWTGCANTIPQAGWQVTIANGHTVTLDTDTNQILALNINSGGTLTATAAAAAVKTLNLSSNPVAISGNLVNNGTLSLGVYGNIKLWAASAWSGSGATWSMNNLDFNNQTLTLGTATINVTVNGNFTNSGAFTSGSGTWTFAGSGAQTISNTAAFTRVAINNTGSGVTLAGGNLTASTLLALSAGPLITGNYAAIAGTDCTTGIARSNGFVQGNLRLTFPSGTNIACTFHVGSGSYYAPIGITANSTAVGTLTGSTFSGDHPNLSSSPWVTLSTLATTSGIASTKSANRYWRLRATGDTAVFSSYGLTLNFNSADLDSSANWYDFIAGIYDGSRWLKSDSITTYATATSISNIVGNISAQTDFAVGEDSDACSLLAGYNTCVCDNFSRTSLNPSTIFGSDWLVSYSSGSFGNPVVNAGALRLTDNSTNVATVAVVPGTFPAAGNKISVEFKHYAYASTTNPGADGIALTLSDSSKTPAAGAYGGSLGYAQKTNIPGFNGGWLGVGLDEWGNYTNPTEGRVGGPGQIAQTVTLRGSGAGSDNSADNYPFLVTTGALSSTIDNRASPSRAPGYKYRVTVDATAYTWNSTTNSGTKTTRVRVERDTGSGYAILPNLDLTDIYSNNTNQANVPNNWKLSFTGGTGSNTNIHEISGLKICSTYYTVPGSFDIQFSSTSGLTCATPGGTPSSPTVTISALTNTGALDTAYTGAVTLRAKLSNGSNSTTAVWRKVGTTTNITNGGTYTFVAGDGGRASFYLTDTAAETLTVTVSDSSVSSTSSSSVAFTSSGSYYTIATADQSSEVVAGRPHLMKVTAYSGCSASPVAVSGSKAMSGWYTPDTVYHPTGATGPTMCPGPANSPTPTNCSAAGTCSNAQLTTSAPGVSNLTLNFGGASSAYFCLNTTDVGKYTLGMQETANTSAKSNSSPLLTARPFALYFNTAKKGSTANPKGGSKFIAAEDTFEGTVSAVQWNTTLAGSNWAQVTPLSTLLPENSTAWNSFSVTPSFATDTPLSLASFSFPSGCVGGSCTGSLGGTTTVSAGSYSGGSAVLPSNSLSFSDVGSIRIGTAVTNYLASGMSISSVSDIVGYFYPAKFSLSGSVTPACSAGGFSYMGQAGLGIAFNLTAQGALGGTTQNYSNGKGYSPLATVSLVAEDDTYGGGDRISRMGIGSLPGVANWSAGVYSYSASSLTFSRQATADGAFDALDIGVQTTDSDGVALDSLDMNASTTGSCAAACTAKKLATTKVRYGRARLLNANGSELLDLPMPLRTEYWTGSRWANNTLDTCTGAGGAGGTVTLSAAAGDTTSSGWVTSTSPFLPCVRDSGSGGSSGMACATAAPSTPVDKHFKTGTGLWTGSDAQNAFNLWLRAPGSGNTGTVVVTAVVPDWLKFKWTGGSDINPTGRAIFGTIKSGKVIYRQEMY